MLYTVCLPPPVYGAHKCLSVANLRYTSRRNKLLGLRIYTTQHITQTTDCVPNASRYNLSPADVLDNVLYVRPESTDHQLSILTRAADEMSHSKFGLLVVDSASALYRREYVGRGELQDRQVYKTRMSCCIYMSCCTWYLWPDVHAAPFTWRTEHNKID